MEVEMAVKVHISKARGGKNKYCNCFVAGHVHATFLLRYV
jgi:hypothetical protein